MPSVHRYSFSVFQQRVQTPSSGAATTQYSSLATWEPLAIFDQIALQIIAQQTIGTAQPKLTVALTHSADGRWWLPKMTAVSAQLLTPNAENVYYGFDDGTVPLLRFARVEVTVSGQAVAAAADVQIEATINDARETQFAHRMRAILKRQKHLEDTHFGCWKVLNGGARLSSSSYWQKDLMAAGHHGGVPAENAGFLRKGIGVFKDEWFVADDAQVCWRGGYKVVLSKPGRTVEIDLHQSANHGTRKSC